MRYRTVICVLLAVVPLIAGCGLLGDGQEPSPPRDVALTPAISPTPTATPEPAWPSGASLHAMAIRCACCLPSNLRLCPGRARSLSALSSPSLTNRVRTRPTVDALINSPLAMSRSIRPLSAFSNTSARLTLRAEVSPRLAISLRCVRSDSFNSTLYLRAGMSSYVLPIGSHTRLTYSLYLSNISGTGTSTAGRVRS